MSSLSLKKLHHSPGFLRSAETEQKRWFFASRACESHVSVSLTPLNTVPFSKYVVNLGLGEAAEIQEASRFNTLFDFFAGGLGVWLMLAFADNGLVCCFTHSKFE